MVGWPLRVSIRNVFRSQQARCFLAALPVVLQPTLPNERTNKMILSASRRTDIPCYYGQWMLNRLTEGYALTRNPMNHSQLSRVSLTPDVVDCIVFWTKDPENFLPYLKDIDSMGYKYYFQFTLTPYGNDVEKNLRPKNLIEDTFIRLSQAIGRERVVWRYDPIIFTDALNMDYHKESFLRLCQRLSDYTSQVVISFVDEYSKIKSSIVRQACHEDIVQLSQFIGHTAKAYGLSPRACCERIDLTPYGITKSSCIDRAVIEKLTGPLALPPDKNQREGCGCAESIDIGAYNTCLNGCVYCYANYSPQSTLKRNSLHDPRGLLLVGEVGEGERVTERKAKSYRSAK